MAVSKLDISRMMITENARMIPAAHWIFYILLYSFLLCQYLIVFL